MPDPVTQIPITVTFDAYQQTMANRFEWSIDGGPVDHNVELPASTGGSTLYALVFTLQSPNSPATWAQQPITWTNGAPQPLPVDTPMPTPGSNQVVIGVDNTNQEPGAPPMVFGFTMSVDYQGDTFTSPDPEVVLKPPGG